MAEVWVWAIFCALILCLVALDLGVLHRKPQVLTTVQALMWSLFWIGLALLFNLFIYFAYDGHWFGLGLHAGSEANGYQAALLFFTGYVVEKSLSLDNIFVIALIFEYYRIPVQYQHRVLLWGVLGALVLRGVMIGAGAVLLSRFSWMNYVFGAFLVYTAIQMFITREETFDPETSRLVRLVRRFVPMSKELVGDHFFTRLNGRVAITPLFLVLLQVEATDVLFAVDSIPAIFAITQDPFIVFTSNIFAVLGLRALYFALAALINRFSYLKVSLVFVLAFVGIKMLLAHLYPIPTYASLAVILVILVIGILPTLLAQPPVEKAIGPLADTAVELGNVTLRQAKRLIFVVTGFTVLLVGLALLVLPGPALVVIPIGLYLLAKEYQWARQLLTKFKESGEKAIRLWGGSNNKKTDKEKDTDHHR